MKSSQLRIQKVSLKNFRKYLGIQEVEFSTDSKKPVTVFHGISGKGKTSFLNALHWCIYGIERDHFQSNDKFNLHFTNLIKEYIGNNNLPYLHFELIQIEDKNVMKVDCLKAKKPVFLKFHKEEEFYMRVGAATTPVSGSKLVEYIGNNFK